MQFISPNELLTALPPVIYERLGPHLQRVRLEAGRILFDVGATIDYTWFIKRGIVSLLLDTENGDSVEVAMAGPNSVIGFLETVTTNEASFRIGEPGTGKELFPRSIHDASGRRGRPFVTFNCVGLNPDLIERKLFGYEKGAFTGALTRRIGCFEQANGGTLFLNEIGDLPLASQSKLLRVLEKRKFERVGGTESITIDTRLIAATNRDILREIDEGRFRRGLYDCLGIYPIRMPALREHPTDIPILIRRYYPFIEFQEGALELLCHYDWPGNVRELRFMVERLAAKAGGRMITTDYVRREIDAA